MNPLPELDADHVPRADPGARTRLPVEIAAGVLRGPHTALILWSLFWGGKGFYQLLRENDGMTRKTLSAELGALEHAGLVRRSAPGRGRKALYSLTPLGESHKLVLGAMYQWGLLVRNSGAELAVEKPPGLLQGVSASARNAAATPRVPSANPNPDAGV